MYNKKRTLKELGVEKGSASIGELNEIYKAKKVIRDLKDKNPVNIKRIKKMIKRKPRFRDLK